MTYREYVGTHSFQEEREKGKSARRKREKILLTLCILTGILSLLGLSFMIVALSLDEGDVASTLLNAVVITCTVHSQIATLLSVKNSFRSPEPNLSNGQITGMRLWLEENMKEKWSSFVCYTEMNVPVRVVRSEEKKPTLVKGYIGETEFDFAPWKGDFSLGNFTGMVALGITDYLKERDMHGMKLTQVRISVTQVSVSGKTFGKKPVLITLLKKGRATIIADSIIEQGNAEEKK